LFLCQLPASFVITVLQSTASSAVARLLGSAVSADYEPDSDLDVTQTEVVLNNDELVGLNVDFSDAEDDNSECESAMGFDDSWLGHQSSDGMNLLTENNAANEMQERAVLPSIKSAIQSSVDSVLMSDNDGR
jgi:hypothetical protein